MNTNDIDDETRNAIVVFLESSKRAYSLNGDQASSKVCSDIAYFVKGGMIAKMIQFESELLNLSGNSEARLSHIPASTSVTYRIGMTAARLAFHTSKWLPHEESEIVKVASLKYKLSNG
jgi:hypothetical protein